MYPRMIEQLLDELYEADPTLRAKEELLRPLIDDLIDAKPNANLDPVVRTEIMRTLRERGIPPTSRQKVYWRFATAALVALVFVVVLYHPNEEHAFVPELNTTTDHAFGPLTDTNTLLPPATTATPTPVAKTGSFVYNGPLNLSGKSVDVLRRENVSVEQDSLAALVDSFELGQKLDVQLAQNPASTSVSLSQDSEYGYDVSVDYVEGSVDIVPNDSQWPDTDTVKIQENQIPTDAESIALSDSFLSEHNITTDGYAKPEVASTSEAAVAVGTRAQVTVVYPMLVDGLPVYEESGVPFGVTVSVDVLSRRISTVRNLATRKYASSTYAAVKDDAIVRDALTRGGWRDAGVQAQGSDTEPVNLATPKRAWMRTWSADPSGTGREILVPALVFPPDNVVIPLASELYTTPKPASSSQGIE